MPRGRKQPKPGYASATASNIPFVDQEMIRLFYKSHPDFLSVEIRGVKNEKAMRERYAMNAIGYVQLKRRADGKCSVIASCTPEHKVRDAEYEVEVVVDEAASPRRIDKCSCQCKAAKGSCKHGLALIYWLSRKSNEPSPTEIECYWKMSPLSAAAKYGEVVRAHEVCNRRELPVRGTPFNFREEYEQQRGLRLIDIQAGPALHPLSLHALAVEFKRTGLPITPLNFYTYIRNNIKDEVFFEVPKLTKSQSESSLWHALRYGRITASIIHQAAHCRTHDGSLVESIMGATTVIETKAIKRGKTLESKVLAKVSSSYQKTGLYICKEYPFLGASPDGLGSDCVFEVKCPSKPETVKLYVKSDGTLTAKSKAQIQLQMKLSVKGKGIFCVASPTFEEDGCVQKIELSFDEQYTSDLIKRAKEFWEREIFPKLIA